MVIVTSISLDRLKVRKVTSKSTTKRTVLNPRRSTRRLTTAEKATVKEIRARRRAKWNKALEEAQEALRDAALVMQSKAPGHQIDHYIRVITQSATRSNVKARKNVTTWNAFVSQETRKRNAGERYFLCFIVAHSFLTVIRTGVRYGGHQDFGY